MDIATLPEYSVLVGSGFEKPGYRISRPNGTPNWLLVFTVSGAGVFRQSECAAGSLLIVRPGVSHEYSVAPRASHWEQLWVHVVLSGPFELHALQLLAGEQFCLYPDIPSECRHWLESAVREPDRLRRLHAVLGALATLEASAGTEPTVVTRAISIFESGLGGEISISEIARAVGVSQSTLTSRFRAELGCSPREKLEALRIQKAKEMLLATNASIQMVSIACGFASPFYFSLRFKKAFGQSPSEYRLRRATRA